MNRKKFLNYILLHQIYHWYYSASDPDPYRIRIQSSQWILIRIRNPDPYWIRIQEGKMTHKNREKFKKFHVLKCLMFSLEA
jgi:hypothetical protein